jgi:dTDP-4-dehydrorhamnose reductase
VRWLVTGAAGMLGTDVVATLQGRGSDVTALDREQLDITDHDAVHEALAGHDVVVNCAAWANVDGAEEQESAAFAVNAVGPHALARSAATHGARLVHLSTDYVFDGRADQPYPEDGPMAPRSAYGRTKAAGEWAVLAADPEHLVVRTAWLYGAHGPCFPQTIARLARERGGLDVIADQVGQPTWTVDLADLVVSLVEARVPGGVYHGTSDGSTTWHAFAQRVVAAAGMDPEIVRPTTSAEYVRPAPRPAYSVLGHERVQHAGIAPIGDWQGRWELAAPTVLG